MTTEDLNQKTSENNLNYASNENSQNKRGTLENNQGSIDFKKNITNSDLQNRINDNINMDQEDISKFKMASNQIVNVQENSSDKIRNELQESQSKSNVFFDKKSILNQKNQSTLENAQITTNNTSDIQEIINEIDQNSNIVSSVAKNITEQKKLSTSSKEASKD